MNVKPSFANLVPVRWTVVSQRAKMQIEPLILILWNTASSKKEAHPGSPSTAFTLTRHFPNGILSIYVLQEVLFGG